MKTIHELRQARLSKALHLWSTDKSLSMAEAGVRVGLARHDVWNSRKANPAAFKAAKLARAAL